MGCCQIVPDSLLKRLGDKISARISNRIRARRNRVRRFLSKLFKTNKPTLAASLSLCRRDTYDCNGTTKLPGTLKLQNEWAPTLTDPQVLAAHTSAGNMWKFLAEVLGRTSIDNKNMVITSSVKYDKNYNNAFWDGDSLQMGTGDGSFFTSLAMDDSVIYHEIIHGVTQHTCNLRYQSQSGMINEALSDIFAVTCRHWVNRQSNPLLANWLIGDKCVGKGFPGFALRSMVPNEPAYKGDDQPSHMKEYKRKWFWEDNGGVHYGSKIINCVYYRMCQNLKSASYDKPIKIVYQAMKKLKSGSNFKDFSKALLAAVDDLGYGPNEKIAVHNALKDTGL